MTRSLFTKGIAGAPSLVHVPSERQLNAGGKKRSKLGRAALFAKAYTGAKPGVGASCHDGFIMGYAITIAKPDGTPTVDSQGDVVMPDQLRKAVFEFMEQGDRPAGFMHFRHPETGELLRAGKIVESLCVTPEITKMLGIEGQIPLGWIVGIEVQNPLVKKMIRDGKAPSFSVGGKAVRVPIEIEE